MHIGRKIPIAIDRYLLDGLIIALLVIIYGPVLMHWYNGWLNKSISITHEYFSHGLIGLPFAANIVWTNRRRWHNLTDTAHPFGVVLLMIGAVSYLSGQSELVNLSFPMVLAGMSLWLKGIGGFKLQSFPLLLVALATPTAVPYLIEPYILPLQRFIAAMAAFILTQFGMNVRLEGINLFVSDRIVEVAPHCAGLKMLFTCLYVSLMLLYWSGAIESRLKTIWLLSGALVISVSANIVRNSVLTFFHGSGQDKAFHWLHESWGGDLYSAMMLVMLVLLMKFIEKYFPSDPNLTPLANHQD
ncbi:cyanoexosortase B [Moorena sp. SIO3I6]|uniref:cyanoexosortase B n=1 Tax=Moorena sp. SIO3I6 TaxID=2607831 RepID=UPI0013F6D8D0|nr:cyanoexosortase B [Moorena sp. SIO3I6]NEP28923.1 cyanoexosortase B [Moorena sp. SIO3I6]